MNMRWERILALAALLLSQLAAGAVVRTVRETIEATDRDYEELRPFDLTGDVVVNDPTVRQAYFHDATGHAAVWFEDTNLAIPDAGSRIRITGRLLLSRCRERILQPSTCDILGRSSPPPPVDVTIPNLLTGQFNLMLVRTSGRIIEAFRDEIDASYTRITLHDDEKSIDVALHNSKMSLIPHDQLINADVRITGICTYRESWRRFSPPFLKSITDLEIVRPAPPDPFDLEHLVNPSRSPLSSDPCGTRMRIDGHVRAVWQGDRMLLQTSDDLLVRMRLTPGTCLPPRGAQIVAAGIVDTDGTNLMMDDVIWKAGPGPEVPPEPATDVRAAALFQDNAGNPALQYPYDGTAVCLTGKVVALVNDDQSEDSTLLVNCDGFMVPVDVSNCPQARQDAAPGSRVKVSGICLIDFENWRRGAPFPHVRGISIVTRQPEDLEILSSPPFWTPDRLFAVIGALFVAIVAILLWNRFLHHLIVQKGRELFRLQIAKAKSELRIDERTSLAAELHDYTAQGLTAVSYQVSAAHKAFEAGSQHTAELLASAERMINASIVELRRCMWDLRNNALDDANFGEAVRKTVAPVSRGASVAISFNVKRSKIGDSAAHAMLSIARELVSNAVRHGKASHIRIAGAHDESGIQMSVLDNGRGFDVSARPDIQTGHFGLGGILERVNRFNGTMTIKSSPGNGCKVTVSFRSAHDDNQESQT